jgi:endonuclease-8
MPEGDTLARTAEGLKPFLAGRSISGARTRIPGPRLERVIGATIVDVVAVGKNLLIRLDNGLELRTHLRLHGSWHRYRPGERWRRPPARASLVLEVPDAVAVCFDCPTVELFEARAAHLHPALGALGPNLLDPTFDRDEVMRRLRAPGRAATEIGPALLDQRALAGIGNVYKSEVLFLERVSPFRRVADLDDETLGRVVDRSRRLLAANALTNGGRGPERITTRDPRTGRPLPGEPRVAGALWVYHRAGRPCHRCGTAIRSVEQGDDLPRLTYWCPSCQPDGAGELRRPFRSGTDSPG